MNRISEGVNIVFYTGLALFIFFPVVTASGDRGNDPNLMELVKLKFPKISSQEKKLFQKVSMGTVADYSTDKKRVLDANSIAWLCTDLKASKLVTHRGIWIKRAHINGKLDLSFANMTFPLRFEKCTFTEDINLEQATVHALDFSGTHTRSIDGGSLTVKGSVYLMNGFQAEGKVNLFGSSIGGYLDCTNGKFINKTERGPQYENIAIEATGINVLGNVNFCNGFESKGTVSLYGATIGRELDCKGGKFIHPGWVAFNGDQMQVDGCVFLSEGFEAEGQVRLIGTTIGRDLDCTNGKFFITSKPVKKEFREALKATDLKVRGNMYLRKGFEAKGMVKLVSSRIDGFLDCSGGNFSNNADVLNIGIVGAIEATRLHVGGNVLMCIDNETKKIFRADGVVSLYGATIGGDLDCKRGVFINPDGYVLNGDSLNIEGDVFLSNGFKAEGKIVLVGAEIGGAFKWYKVDSPEKVTLDLSSATIGTLWDEEESWPETGKLFLHGLIYNKIHNSAPKDSKSRIEWLKRQSDFSRQPYEQLAAVLHNTVSDTDTKKILIAKNREKAHSLVWYKWVWNTISWMMNGYGYRPWRSFWIGCLCVLFSTLIFGIGRRVGLFKASKEVSYILDDSNKKSKVLEECPRFNALTYSLDVFVPLRYLAKIHAYIPLLELQQADHWEPDVEKGRELVKKKRFTLRTGRLLRIYMWIYIVVGWIVVISFVASLTGLARS